MWGYCQGSIVSCAGGVEQEALKQAYVFHTYPSPACLKIRFELQLCYEIFIPNIHFCLCYVYTWVHT